MSLVHANIAAYAAPRAHAGRRTSTSRTRSPAPKSGVALRKARGTVVPRAVVDPAAVVPALNSKPDEFAVLEATPDDTYVDVVFKDGASFRFHALWLRDACSDPNHVVADAGERILSMLPVNTGCDANLRATRCEMDEIGGLVVHWTNHEIPSTFDAKSLRAFADVVAQPLADGSEIPPLAASETEWLDPFTGYPDAPGQSPSQIDYFKNEDGVVFPSYDHDAVVRDPKLKLDVMRDLMRAGAVVIDDVPTNEVDSGTLHAFVDDVLGGMQKDPCRDERNWKIVKKADASSISYDPEKRLNNHTDQSVPPWGGVPALVLIMHYQKGFGCNTLVDGFKVAEDIRATDPEAFEMLTTYGSNQTRDFVSSRKDTTQALNASLCVHKREPIIQLDDAGNIARIQYNEVFRTPLELPFDVFPKWYAAYTKWVRMLHDTKYEVEVDMQAGKMLIFHNWRTLHGRAGGKASKDRTLIGGTVTREAFFSRATELLEETAGYDMRVTGTKVK